MVIGVISDTHGLLRPEAVAALRGVDHIIHAGDIGKLQVIKDLEALAPVTAVRGNCDQEPWAYKFPVRQRLSVEEEITILVLHNLHDLKRHGAGNDVRVVISGHTHSPAMTVKDEVLYLNPGSAGRRRFNLPVSLALLKVEGARLSAEFVRLGE